jgi:hypothetical protein
VEFSWAPKIVDFLGFYRLSSAAKVLFSYPFALGYIFLEKGGIYKDYGDNYWAFV